MSNLPAPGQPAETDVSPASPFLHDRAADNLRFIRETMERAGSFTAVSGTGIMAAGAIGAVAALVVAGRAAPGEWIATWVVAAAAALSVSLSLTARKARSLGLPLVSGPGRKFFLAFTPALAAGAVVTVALVRAGHEDLLAGVWLLLYGAGVTAGGAFSVPVVPVMGLSCMACGAAALFAPSVSANWFMLAGFGLVHLVFGFFIARRFGG